MGKGGGRENQAGRQGYSSVIIKGAGRKEEGSGR